MVVTRLELTPETWTTRIELADTAAGGTRVTMTITHEPTGGSRLVRRLQRGALRRWCQRTVDAELDKVPAHVALVRGGDTRRAGSRQVPDRGNGASMIFPGVRSSIVHRRRTRHVPGRARWSDN